MKFLELPYAQAYCRYRTRMVTTRAWNEYIKLWIETNGEPPKEDKFGGKGYGKHMTNALGKHITITRSRT